jgi:hypothetical protein
MEPGRLQLDDRLHQFLVACQDFRQTNLVFHAEIGRSRGTAQIRINQQRFHAVCLREQPSEIQTRQSLSFTDTGAGDHERTHVLSLARFQKFRAQRTKVLAFRRARFRNRDEVWFDARGRDCS